MLGYYIDSTSWKFGLLIRMVKGHVAEEEGGEEADMETTKGVIKESTKGTIKKIIKVLISCKRKLFRFFNMDNLVAI